MTDFERLEGMLAVDDELTLSEEQITDLLAQSRIVDSNGRRPSDPGYVTTHDLSYAAYRGWLLKAALAVSKISFSSEGARFDRDQYMKHCELMAKFYGKSLAGSVRLG